MSRVTAYAATGAVPFDAAVVRGMRAGADWAWNTAWDELAPPLAAYVRSIGADTVEAEDLVSEAITRLIAHRDRLPEAPGSVRAWAFAVARNLFIDDRRSARHRRTRTFDAHEHETRAIHVDAVDDSVAVVMAALDSLPGQQRELIVLHVYGELTLREAAYVLGMSHAGARKAYSRAAGRLRATIDISSRARDTPIA